jgi:ribonuclease P protein component
LVTAKLKFTQANRLQTPADYQAVFNNQPICSRSSYFTVLARPNNRQYGRLGIIVAKRLIKKAVHRNTVKRLIRTEFRVHQRELAGLDIIVLVRRSLKNKAPNTRIFSDCLKQQWKELSSLSPRV